MAITIVHTVMSLRRISRRESHPPTWVLHYICNIYNIYALDAAICYMISRYGYMVCVGRGAWGCYMSRVQTRTCRRARTGSGESLAVVVTVVGAAGLLGTLAT
eukprot:GHVU01086107.1.p1 GENE.GHVU01086107.1~~GHVU01086107.1.p1  ORF type:complete len:103 (-),score=2.68 GHVU01086107.1:171-479(-)